MRPTHAQWIAIAVSALVLGTMPACSTYRETQGRPVNQMLVNDARATIDLFRRHDPSINRFFDAAAGYAVFPEVAQGGAGIGAAHGRGVVFQGGVPIGEAELSAGTIGAQLGGQTYSEIIFFQTPHELERFKRGETKFSASASAVAASSGAAAKADYANGVAVFVANQSGLMFEASIGGQSFKFWPM